MGTSRASSNPGTADESWSGSDAGAVTLVHDLDVVVVGVLAAVISLVVDR